MRRASLPIAKQNGHPYFGIVEDVVPLTMLDSLLLGVPNQNNDVELRGLITSLCRRTMPPLRVSLVLILLPLVLSLASSTEPDPRRPLDRG